MSFSTLRQLLTQSLSRFLRFFVSFRGLAGTSYRSINQLLAFLSSLLRWTRTSNSYSQTLRQLEGSAPSPATLDDGIVYPMNLPSPETLDTLGRGWHSHTDLPYITERSRSGGHLVPPTPARRYSRDALWNTSTDGTTIHDEPDPIGHGTSHVMDHCISGTDLSTNAQNLQDSYIPSSSIHTHPSLPPNLRHQTSSLSIRSPSRMSHNSTRSTGRASYREHHGPPARVHVPTSAQNVSILGSSSSTTLQRGELSDVAAFENTIAPPDMDESTQCGYRFFPISAKDVLRYERGRTRSSSGCDHTIEAMRLEYPKTLQGVPEGWTAHRHPEGALYFVHDESKTFTEVNICDPEIHEDIEYFKTFLFSELQDEIKNRNLAESLDIDEVQLVLEPKDDKLGVMCCYYFVNPRTRSLFWLDEWNATSILEDCKGILSTPHKGLAVQAHYWCVMCHWSLYPSFCEVTEELKDEVVNTILHGICDHLTSEKPISPLNAKELKSHLSLIREISPNKTDKYGHYAIIIGRIMWEFYRVYFLHFHGEDCARLDHDKMIHGWRYHPSPLMKIFAPLLFMAPVHNVRQLHRIYVDDIVKRETWNKFVDKLNAELADTSLLATVLLNANVAFLQVLGPGSSSQQFLTYTSLVASVASIILGLVFIGHSRAEARTTAPEAATFLKGMWDKKHGLESLAIIYSLPHSFLVWGMILFSAAFSIQWSYPGHTGWRGGAGAFMLVVMLLIAWCVWTTRDRRQHWWFQPHPKHVESEGPGGGSDSNVSFGIPRFNRLHQLTTLFFRRSILPESHSGESYPMPTVVLSPPSGGSQTHSHVGPHAALQH